MIVNDLYFLGTSRVSKIVIHSEDQDNQLKDLIYVYSFDSRIFFFIFSMSIISGDGVTRDLSGKLHLVFFTFDKFLLSMCQTILNNSSRFLHRKMFSNDRAFKLVTMPSLITT